VEKLLPIAEPACEIDSSQIVQRLSHNAYSPTKYSIGATAAMRLRVGSCYQNVQQAVEPFSGKVQGVSGSLCGTALAKEHGVAVRYSFNQYCPRLVLKPLVGQEQVEPLLGGFPVRVGPISVSASFALLTGRLSAL